MLAISAIAIAALSNGAKPTRSASMLIAPKVPTSSSTLATSIEVRRRALLASSFGLLASPLVADAKYGDEPKFEMPRQAESTLGSRAQESGSRPVWDLEAARLAGEALEQKKKKVVSEWVDLEARVDKQLAKGQLQEVQSTLGLKMATIKTNMRDTARAMNGGDNIVYREGSRDQPVFDYNIGTYELTAEAKRAEDVFAEINRLSVAAGLRDTDTAADAWAKSKQAFKAYQEGLL